MPRTLTEQEYNAVKDRVLASAPDGLDEAGFTRWAGPAMAQAITEAEQTPAGGRGLAGFGSALAETLNPLPAIAGLATAVRHPIDTADAIVGAQLREGSKAADEWKAGHYSEALGHGAAAALPVLGPAAAAAGERIGSGDVAGGLGQSAGLLAQFAGPEVLKGVAAIAEPAVSRVGVRLTQSALKPTATLEKSRNLDKAGIAQEVYEGGWPEGVVSKGSLRRIKGREEGIDNDVLARVEAADLAGRPASVAPVAQAITDAIDKGKVQFAPGTWERGATRTQNEIAQQLFDATQRFQQANQPGQNVPRLVGQIGPPSGDMAVGDLLALKRGTSQGLDGTWGMNPRDKAVIAIKQAASRGAGESIRDALPEMGDLWDAQRTAITRRDAIQAALDRRGNHDILSMSKLKDMALNPVQTAIALADSAPMIKTGIAQTLRSGLSSADRVAEQRQILRAAILAALGGESQDQHP